MPDLDMTLSGLVVSDLVATRVKEATGGGCRLAILHGNGNVIAVIISESELPSPAAGANLARDVCSLLSHPQIEGLAFVSTTGGLFFRFWDRDGTFERMCGNGLRCATRLLADSGHLADRGTINTDDGPRQVVVGPGPLRVSLGTPAEYRQLGDTDTFVWTGVAHLVRHVPCILDVDAVVEGRTIRNDKHLSESLGHPEGLHVNFVQRGPGHIVVRTYEVGVEDVTMSCGTGVAASAYVAHQRWNLDFPMRVETLGGDMSVHLDNNELWISGNVEYVAP